MSTTDQDSVNEAPRTVAVWDIPTRLFHWTLVALVTISVVSGNLGGLRIMEIHMVSGIAILALILFRLVWGVIGSHHARFASFVVHPRTALAYARSLLRGRARRYLGHNPMGAWSVVALLCVLLGQATTGLFANDDILTEGPLADLVSKPVSDALTEVHEMLSSVLYLLVGLHLLVVFGYLVVKGENLIRPMLTGVKVAEPGGEPAMPLVGTWRAVPALAAAGGIVYLILQL